jgi:cysteine synthase A
VTFGQPAAARRIPGLGASRTPPLFRPGQVDREVQVPERDAIRTCRMLARRYGYLAGGSTGSIVAALLALEPEIPEGSVLVALSPDAGERYLNTVYDDDWVRRWYGADALGAPLPDVADALPAGR